MGSVRCCLKNKERKKKAVQGHFLRRLGQVRQPQGTDRDRSPGPYPGLRGWEPRGSAARTLLAQELGGSREAFGNFGLSESFWIFFPPYPMYSSPPLF